MEQTIAKREVASKKDDELVKKAQEGDKQAQEILLNKYKNLVKKISGEYTVINGDSQDITQEGMIGLYMAIKDFDISRGVYFHVFAKTCIKRQISTFTTKTNRKKHSPLNEALSFSEEGVEAKAENILRLESPLSQNPEQIIIDKERNENIRKFLIETLTDKELIVAKMYLNGYTYFEMASEIGITEKGISSTIQRIKKKIGSNIDYIL